MRHKYRKRSDRIVTAIQINLKLEGGRLGYHAWGGDQEAKEGDWLLENDGECYTVDKDTFAETYERNDLAGPNRYFKKGAVWAHIAHEDGSIPTKEGETRYKAGDYIVSNNEDGTDSYAVEKRKFEDMYRIEL